jgi:methionine-R-sulfoxide reductase
MPVPIATVLLTKG